MNTAFFVWTVALGGWILPEVGEFEMHRGPTGLAAAPRLAASELRGGTVSSPARPTGGEPAARRPFPHVPRQQAPAMSPSHASRQQMPAVPTAPDAGMHHSPTSPGGYHAGPSGASPYGTRMPGTVPGAARPSYPPPGIAQPQPSRIQPATIGAGIPAGPIAGSVAKPFSDYQQLPVVSPYLHLERPDGLDFDNYNTLVRPFTEQFHRNNQLQNEVRGLQNTIDQQYRSIQQMNRQMDSLEGRTQPRQFQDTGGFFPTP